MKIAGAHLVEEELVVLVRQVVVRLDDLVEVRLHQLEYHVDVLEVVLVRRQKDAPHRDNVPVFEQPQQFNLPQYPSGIADVLEDVRNLFDRDAAAIVAIRGARDDTIAPLPNELSGVDAAA